MIKNLKNLEMITAMSMSGISAQIILEMMKVNKSLENIFESIPFLRKGRTLLPIDFLKQAKEEVESMQNIKGHIVSCLDEAYPSLLKNSSRSPAVLYCLGDISLLKQDCASVVGSRNASVIGLKMASSIAASLVENNYVVVSGLAMGVDTMSHQTALDKQGKTIAVIGCGLDINYPPENKILQRRIAECGLLVSQFPLGSRPIAKRFPIRNATIASLSHGVAVIEARKHSGSLITARIAAQEGREVAAAPGSPFDPNFAGANDLIKNGAMLLDSPTAFIEILESVRHLFRGVKEDHYDHYKEHILEFSEGKVSVKEIVKIREKLISKMPSSSPFSVDDLVKFSGLSVSDIIIGLVSMELDGEIERVPGFKYIKTTTNEEKQYSHLKVE